MYNAVCAVNDVYKRLPKTSAVKDVAARAGANMDAPDIGAGAGPSAAEAVPTSDEATAAAAAATVRILSFRVAAICFSILLE